MIALMTAKTVSPNMLKLANYMAVVVLAILFLLPFHAFFTTWAASHFGYIDQFRVWKEILIIGLALGSALLITKDKPLRQQLRQSKLAVAIGLYISYALLRTGYGYSAGLLNDEALAYGVIGAFRYLVFFLVVWIIASRSQLLQKWWPFAVITPATIVIVFGLLQQFILDKNFLTHFGYGQDTIPAFQGVDQKTSYARAQSTLRGPNPLGAYLSFIITVLAGLWYRLESYRFTFGFLAAMASVVLFFTYSRSAWIGLVISMATWLLLVIKDKKIRNFILISGLLLIAALALTTYALRDNDYVQNTIFHTDETSQSTSSTNTVRAQALQSGLQDVWQHPLGQGLGTAGPASTRGQAPKIAENYYIQVAQEVGVFGLVLYLAITVLVAAQLFQRRQDVLAQVLLASLAGITAINMVSHAWMDDTLSLLWWGLAGIALTPVIMKSNHGQKQTKNAQKTA